MDHVDSCFCEISLKKLLFWGRKKFGEGRNTVALLQEAKSHEDKDAIQVLALLDVDEKLLLELMQDVSKTDKHIIACRSKTKQFLGRRFTFAANDSASEP